MKFTVLDKLLALQITRKTRNILLIVLAVIFFLLLYPPFVKKDMTDFSVCYQGGQRIIKGETLYRVSDGHLQYKYSPASAVFFSLFSFLPYEVAKLIWYLLELILLYLGLVISYDVLPSKHKKKGFIVILTFLIMAKFLGREIELGQVNIFIFFLLIVMVKAAVEKKDVKGGLFWGFSLLFKPYALVFLPYFALKKRFKLIASGLATALLGFIVPLIFYGFSGNLVVLREWYTTLSKSTPSLIDHYDNASIHAFFLKNFPSEQRDVALIFIMGIALIIGVAFLWIMYLGKKKDIKEPEILEFSFLLILIPLFSPLAWYYNYIYSILTVALLLNLIGKFPPVLKYVLIIDLIAIGASLREILGKYGFRFYTQHSLVVISYLIVLFYLLYSRIKDYS